MECTFTNTFCYGKRIVNSSKLNVLGSPVTLIFTYAGHSLNKESSYRFIADINFVLTQVLPVLRAIYNSNNQLFDHDRDTRLFA